MLVGNNRTLILFLLLSSEKGIFVYKILKINMFTSGKVFRLKIDYLENKNEKMDIRYKVTCNRTLVWNITRNISYDICIFGVKHEHM